MNIRYADRYWIIINVVLREYVSGCRRVTRETLYTDRVAHSWMYASKKDAEDAILHHAGKMNKTLEVRNLLTEFLNEDATLYTQPELPLAQDEKEEHAEGRNEEDGASDRPDGTPAAE